MAYLSPGVYVEEVPSSVKPIAGVSTSTAAFLGQLPAGAKEADPVLVTSWTQFTKAFGDFVADVAPSPPPGPTKAPTPSPTSAATPGETPAPTPAAGPTPAPTAAPISDADARRYLAHAVYGFFNNGGSRCYVVRCKAGAHADALRALARIDGISIVAAPGIVDDAVRGAVVTHCENNPGRFAILDGPAGVASEKLGSLTKIASDDGGLMPAKSNFAAWYFPWIRVFDPAAKKPVDVPPSGHVAGVYARVDTERGVHKAPANEVIRGALGVTQPLSKAEQDLLNPKGVNCIRVLNDNVLVWGARTVGGDDNADLKYINVRRTLLFLRKSIEAGTQWVVFEPNDPALWQKITRNVDAFLTNVWRGGALFGATPQQAFYVRCDATNNPPELRDIGQVVTEIGVALVRPAEFVIFRISQSAAAA
jgi:phage tail sheath protein FI